MLDPIHLAALVASRICHDLISPIGAIGNGVELMIMDASGASSQEMALIVESAGHANARIRFFRIAFGLCGPDQRIGRGEVAGVLNDLAAGARTQVVWNSPQDLPRRDAKMAFLGLMCLETALIQGGDIDISMGSAGWNLTARAARIKQDTALWGGLARDASPDVYDDIAAGHVHFPLLALEAARQHRSVSVNGGEAEGALTISF